jgi:hypothetical protein
MEAIAFPLFEFSKKCLKDRGNFLPHAAVLTAEGRIELVGAQGTRDITNAKEILPILHDGLRSMAKSNPLDAIGVAENVTITPPGQSPTKAIKVLFEHRRGLVVALYLPFEKKFLKGLVYGTTISTLAKPEIAAW